VLPLAQFFLLRARGQGTRKKKREERKKKREDHYAGGRERGYMTLAIALPLFPSLYSGPGPQTGGKKKRKEGRVAGGCVRFIIMLFSFLRGKE